MHIGWEYETECGGYSSAETECGSMANGICEICGLNEY